MITIITIIHVIVSLALILIVLLQAGKGADIAGAFGGGASQTAFGSQRGNIMTKMTTLAAILFMCTSLLFSCENLSSRSATQKMGKEAESGQTTAPAAAPASNEAAAGAQDQAAQPAPSAAEPAVQGPSASPEAGK